MHVLVTWAVRHPGFKLYSVPYLTDNPDLQIFAATFLPLIAGSEPTANEFRRDASRARMAMLWYCR